MLSIRQATAEDVPLLHTMIHELADFEHLNDEASVSEEDLLRTGFGPAPKFRAVIAEWDGQPAGYAIFFEFFSSFQGCPGLFLDDHLCAADIPQEGHRQGAARARRRNRLPRKIFLHALGSPGLEHAGDRNVQESRRRLHG